MGGGLWAARVFSGRAGPEAAAQQLQQLRDALAADGVAADGSEWVLARYNDPGTAPPFRRNEVLVPLQSFDLWG